MGNKHTDFWKVTIRDLEFPDDVSEEVHNRVSNEGLGDFLNHYKDDNLQFIVEPLSKEEFNETE